MTAARGSASTGEDSARRRLHAALPLVELGAQPPWPPALVALCGGGGTKTLAAFAELVKPLVRHDLFKVGAEVLAYYKRLNSWQHARITQVLNNAEGEGSRYHVLMSGPSADPLPAKHVLSVSDSGLHTPPTGATEPLLQSTTRPLN